MRVNKKGISFVEVLVCVVILSMGITGVYQAYLKSLDYLSYLHVRLHATFLLDNRFSEIQKHVAMSSDIPQSLLNSQEQLTIANRDITFEFNSDLKHIEPFSNLIQIDMILAWVQNDRRVQLSRSAYILK